MKRITVKKQIRWKEKSNSTIAVAIMLFSLLFLVACGELSAPVPGIPDIPESRDVRDIPDVPDVPDVPDTPVYKATLTPVPVVTYTPVPTATNTPSPTVTFTPVPTNTPLPTATPLPTNTPLPTATPTPDPDLLFNHYAWIGDQEVLLFNASKFEKWYDPACGVMVVSDGESCGAFSFDNEEILPMEYQSFSYAPNSSGYFTLKNNGEKLLFDKNGNIVTRVPDTYRILATVDGYEVITDEGNCMLYDYKGNLLDSFSAKKDMYICGFFDGFIVEELGYTPENGRFASDHCLKGGYIGEDSTVNWMEIDARHPGIESLAFRVISPMNHGYFLAYSRFQSYESVVLMNENGIVTWFGNYNNLHIKGDALNIEEDDPYGNPFNRFSADGWDEEGDADFVRYYDGTYFFNYGSKVLIKADGKYVLMDLAGDKLKYQIFDYCVMSKTKYWLISKDD